MPKYNREFFAIIILTIRIASGAYIGSSVASGGGSSNKNNDTIKEENIIIDNGWNNTIDSNILSSYETGDEYDVEKDYFSQINITKAYALLQNNGKILLVMELMWR